MSWYQARRESFKAQAFDRFLFWLLVATTFAGLGLFGVTLAETKALLMISFLLLVMSAVSAFIMLCHAIDAFSD